jgi:1,4-dihydroxy-2-naphthoate octaprenyltransferase
MPLKLNEWILAARLRTIPLSVSGILIGSFAAFSENKFNISIFLTAIFTAISYQILSNFSNDFGDGIKGTDDNRIGPERVVQSGRISQSEMKQGVFILIIISFSLTLSLAILSFWGNAINIMFFILLGLLAITAAIKYTVGENAYGYSGFGDLFVFLFFGLISVLGSNYLFTSTLNYILIYPSCIIGLLSVGVLNLNNMRDIENDRKSKKNTIAVKLGVFKSKLYHFFLIFSAIVLIAIFQVKLESNSNLLLFLIVCNILWLIFHVFQVSKIKTPKKFDEFLKPLGLSAFLYSIILSLYFYEIL